MRRCLVTFFLIVYCAVAQQNFSLMSDPHHIFVDKNGRPLSGGKVYTCSAGVTCPGNPQATFTDSSGTVQNANPVVLDYTGYASIWLAQGAYKIVVTDANGVQQWTQDNITGSTFGPGISASALLAANYSGGDCGAKINSADESLGSIPGEIWVSQACGLSWTTPVVLSANHILRFIQGGTYQSSASTMITMNAGTQIDGGQMGSTTLQSTVTTGITINAGSGDKMRITNIAIQPSGTPVSGSCITVAGTSFSLDNSYLFNCWIGVEISGGAMQYINTVEIRNSLHYGISVDAPSGGEEHIAHVVMDNATVPVAGIHVSNSGGLWISDSDIIRSTIGLLINPATGQEVNFMFVNDASFDTNSTAGITISPSDTGKVVSLNFTGVWTSSNGNGVAVAGSGGTIDTLSFVNHRAFNNMSAGIVLNAGTNISIDSSNFAGNSTGTSGTSPGIAIAAGVSNFSISNCRLGPQAQFPNTQNYGIVVNSGASDNYIIIGNNTQGNVTGGIFNGGTGSHTVVANNL